jgi:hypothetical protein
MNPIAQKAMGIGALVGFAATFAAGSPVSETGAMQLVLHSILGGFIFGALGFVAGELMHRFVAEGLEKEIEAILMQKELKRQEKKRKAEEAVEAMKAAGITPEVQFTMDVPETEAAGSEEPSTA